MGETWKIRDKVIQYCVGKGLDLGCGDEKICSDAIGVDIRQTQAVDMIFDIAKRLPFRNEEFNYVFSSHALEHLDGEISDTLKDWVRIIKPGGFLILYLPHRDYYKEPNQEHKRELCENDIFPVLASLNNLEVIDSGLDIGDERYSFWMVTKKK